MRPTHFLLLLLLTAFSTTSIAAAPVYWSKSEQGWFWYKTQPVPPPPPVPEIPKPVVAPGDKVFSSAWFKDNLDRYKEAALDNPSPQNIKTYMYLQRLAMDKAQAFAEGVKLAVYNNPALDESNRSPGNRLALGAVNEATLAAKKAVLGRLAKGAGIWFFYRSDCPYCKAEEPVLRTMQNLYGFHVLPISLDGRPMPDGMFPDFVADQGQASRLGVTVTPTMYLVAPPDKVLKISEGVLASDQIEDRIVELGHQSKWIDDEEYASVQSSKNQGGYLQTNLPTDVSQVGDDPKLILGLLEAAANSGGSTPLTTSSIAPSEATSQ